MADDGNKQVQNYILQLTLGKGTFGKVKLAYHVIVDEYVAVKILEKKRIETDADLVRVQREISILRRVKHPNIVQLYEILESESNLYLVMEYAKGGELFDYIVKKNLLQENVAQRFFIQLIHVIEYLHSKHIVHRDLKPENLLLDESRNLKVADFGLSNTYQENQQLITACGSPCYAAPEMLYGKPYGGVKSDIWSCGIILYAMLCGYLPFEHENTKKLYEMIKTQDFERPSHLSPNSVDLLKKLLTKDPNQRINFDEIKTHPFFQRAAIFQQPNVQGKDKDILKKMSELGYDPDLVMEQITKNKHNAITAMFYLLRRKSNTIGKQVQQQLQRRNYFQNLQNACNYKIDLVQGSTGGSVSNKKLVQLPNTHNNNNKRTSMKVNQENSHNPYMDPLHQRLKSMQNSMQTRRINQMESRQKAISVQEKAVAMMTSPEKISQVSAIQSRKESRQKVKLQIFRKKNTSEHGNKTELTEQNLSNNDQDYQVKVRNKTQPLKKMNEIMDRYNKQQSHQVQIIQYKYKIVIKSIHQSPQQNSVYSKVTQNSQVSKLKTIYKPNIRHFSNNDNMVKVQKLLTHNFV